MLEKQIKKWRNVKRSFAFLFVFFSVGLLTTHYTFTYVLALYSLAGLCTSAIIQNNLWGWKYYEEFKTGKYQTKKGR